MVQGGKLTLGEVHLADELCTKGSNVILLLVGLLTQSVRRDRTFPVVKQTLLWLGRGV